MSLKFKVIGDEVYLVTGDPINGYVVEVVTETEHLGRYRRSFEAMRACQVHAEGDDPREAA